MASSSSFAPRPRNDDGGGALMFQFLKAAAIGAIAGLGAYGVNQVFTNRQIVTNKFVGQLPVSDLDGLAEESDLCEYFHMLNVKQLRKYNPRAYDMALVKCNDLCFLGESIANGLLNEESSKLSSSDGPAGTGAAAIHDYETEALHLWYEIHDNLQALYNSVRNTEYEKVEQRDQQEVDYQLAVQKWETDLVQWQTRQMNRRKAQAAKEQESFDPFGDSEPVANNSNNGDGSDIPADDPKPEKPAPPANEKFRSDFVDEYATAIDLRTRQVFVYIRDTVEKFRKHQAKLQSKKKKQSNAKHT